MYQDFPVLFIALENSPRSKIKEIMFAGLQLQFGPAFMFTLYIRWNKRAIFLNIESME